MSLPAVESRIEASIVDRHTLGMAEMGYRGLSEQWLLRRAGDLHWQLIARAMGQRDAVFTCADGQPLYAAFCATSLHFTSPELPQPGNELTLAVDLYRTGHGRLGSIHRITTSDQEIGRLVLISTFVGRSDPASNRSIVRRAPRVMAIPPEAPPAIQRIARQASMIARLATREKPELCAVECQRKILPCPSTDFNAAGLLYFPSFSAIAERAAFEDSRSKPGLMRSRHAVYLGNAEPGEYISVAFHKFRNGYDATLYGERHRPLALMRCRMTEEQRDAAMPST